MLMLESEIAGADSTAGSLPATDSDMAVPESIGLPHNAQISLPGETIALHSGHLRRISSNNRPQLVQNFESLLNDVPHTGQFLPAAGADGAGAGGTGDAYGTVTSAGGSGMGIDGAVSSYLFPHTQQKHASSSIAAPQNGHTLPVIPAETLPVPDISGTPEGGTSASSLAPHSMQNKLSSVIDAPQFVQ